MATYATDIHGPDSTARTQTNKVAHCAVCGVQWQVRGQADVKGCAFCGASKSAISIEYEGPNRGGAVRY